MDREFGGELNQIPGVTYLLQPGFIYFNKRPALVRTVLGSCVSVCLWDRKLHYGAMNHFLYPDSSRQLESTAQFGNASTAALVRMMTEAGCRRKDLVAQIFGGGYPEDTSGRDLGAENVEAARRVLSRKKIKVVSQDVGGTIGRKIAFDIGTGNVAVMKVLDIRDSDWHQYDH